MKFTLIRSATIVLEYAGKKFIIDPYFAAKYSLPSYTGKSLNPLVDLPCEAKQVLQGVDTAFISHLHSDHFDPAAQELLPSDLPILCQPCDLEKLKEKGFIHVIPVADQLVWDEIKMTRTVCQHGSGKVLQEMGDASGFVLEHETEPTVYWAGDTIWCQAVEAVICQRKPSVIITHSGGAVWGNQVSIIMNAEQTVKVCMAALSSTVIATHMEALDHTTTTRQALRNYAEAHAINAEHLLIPFDGQTFIFNR